MTSTRDAPDHVNGGEEDPGVDIGVSSYLLLILSVDTVSTSVTPVSTLSTRITVYRSHAISIEMQEYLVSTPVSTPGSSSPS